MVRQADKRLPERPLLFFADHFSSGGTRALAPQVVFVYTARAGTQGKVSSID